MMRMSCTLGSEDQLEDVTLFDFVWNWNITLL